MLNLLAFAVNVTALVTGIKIALVALALISAVFIIVIVMTGSSKSADESETYYNRNAGSRKERILKILTYVAAGVLAVASIVAIILQTFIS